MTRDRVTLDGTHGMQHLHLLVAHLRGVEGDGRLHRRQTQQLHHVVLHHVAQRARGIVVGAPPFHPEVLGHGDLHVVDELLVPERLEDAVGEPHDQDVLHRLLAQVMVDAVDLLLREDLERAAVQLPRRFEVMAKRLLDDDAGPWSPRGSRQTRAAQLADDLGIVIGRCGEVEEMIAARATLRVNPFQRGGEVRVGGGIAELALREKKTAGEIVPYFGSHGPAAGELVDTRQHLLTEHLVGPAPAREPNHGETGRQEPVTRDVVEGGNQLPAREVACRAKDDKGARHRLSFARHGFVKRVSMHQMVTLR